MNKILLAITLGLMQLSFAQDFSKQFATYAQSNDTVNQLRVLKEWNLEHPTDPELFTSYFNYHINKARQEVLSLTTNEPNSESFVLRDSLNRAAGYLGSSILYNPKELQKAFVKIDKGIELYPNRLDMRFGKIYMLGEIKDWEKFTLEIQESIEQSAKNNNAWVWTNDEKYRGGEKEFLLDLQTYQIQLYETGNEELLENMREVANTVLKFYPNHIESLSNLSITYLVSGEYDKGLEPLLHAEKKDPKDHIVLSNIAEAYKMKGDKAKAVEYYHKVILFGDLEAKEYAQQQIAELQK